MESTRLINNTFTAHSIQLILDFNSNTSHRDTTFLNHSFLLPINVHELFKK